MKVMIVDDHSGIRRMLRSLLSTRGVDLAECADGNEVLGAYEGFQPDWVFMDSSMKGLDGLSATRQLLSRHAEARVLIVSEDDFEQLRRAARAAGACGFITKDRLLQTLAKHQDLPWRELETEWMIPN